MKSAAPASFCLFVCLFACLCTARHPSHVLCEGRRGEVVVVVEGKRGVWMKSTPEAFRYNARTHFFFSSCVHLQRGGEETASAPPPPLHPPPIFPPLTTRLRPRGRLRLAAAAALPAGSDQEGGRRDRWQKGMNWKAVEGEGGGGGWGGCIFHKTTDCRKG